jgi:hypothetical protein
MVMDLLAKCVTKLPAGSGFIPSGSLAGAGVDPPVPEITVMNRSLAWKCDRLLLWGSHFCSMT